MNQVLGSSNVNEGRGISVTTPLPETSGIESRNLGVEPGKHGDSGEAVRLPFQAGSAVAINLSKANKKRGHTRQITPQLGTIDCGTSLRNVMSKVRIQRKSQLFGYKT